MFHFQFQGGVIKPSEHSLEKFLLFFLVGGKTEVPLYQLLRDGLVQRVRDGGDEFVTSYDVAKLFVLRKGFGIAPKHYSFYMRLKERNGAVVQVLPFSGTAGGHGFYFKACCNFLTRTEVLDILPEDIESRIFVERQETLSLDLLEKMVSVDKSEMKKGIRVVRIGQKGEKS